MNSDNKNFKLADSVLPLLEEGKYTVKAVQNVTVPQKDSFSSESEFFVAADTEKLDNNKIFSVYPNTADKGDYSGTLPFIVLNDPVYPWLCKLTEDIDGFAVPWLALIVVRENEVDSETDVKHSELASLKENGVYFPYDNNCVTTSSDNDNVHLLTLSKDIFNNIIPSKEDLIWLAHAKYVNLSASEDSIAEQDGWFSTVIANRFVPSEAGKEVRSTAHLVSMKGYFSEDIPSDCSKIRMISLYHMDICSAAVSEKSFSDTVKGLSRNSRDVSGFTVMPHYLRTGEKTYSIYHSPLVPENYERSNDVNGDEKYTSDGRIIYDSKNGVFDVSYSAAFEIGRMITLSHRAEAEKINLWRKEQAVSEHMKKLDAAIGTRRDEFEELCIKLVQGDKI